MNYWAKILTAVAALALVLACGAYALRREPLKACNDFLSETDVSRCDFSK